MGHAAPRPLYRATWRCRHGFHQWTQIPEDIQRMAAQARVGMRQPDGYAGRRGPKRCWRCNASFLEVRYGMGMRAEVDRVKAGLHAGKPLPVNVWTRETAPPRERTEETSIAWLREEYASERIEIEEFEEKVAKALRGERFGPEPRPDGPPAPDIAKPMPGDEVGFSVHQHPGEICEERKVTLAEIQRWFEHRGLQVSVRWMDWSVDPREPRAVVKWRDLSAIVPCPSRHKAYAIVQEIAEQLEARAA